MKKKKEKEKHGQGHMRQERTRRLSLAFTHTQTRARHLSLQMKNKIRLKKDIFTFFPADTCKLLQMFFDKTVGNFALIFSIKATKTFMVQFPKGLCLRCCGSSSKCVVFGNSFPLNVSWC